MEKPTWLEVSLVVDGELVEAISDVLSRYTLNGIVIENLSLPTKDAASSGKVRVFGYLAVDDKLEERKQKLEESLWYLSRIQPLPEPEYRFSEEQDWSEAWKKHYKPVPIGKKLEIIPAWFEPISDDRISIKIEPGMAFGTGTHPTTQLCLHLIEVAFTGDYPTSFSAELRRKLDGIRQNPDSTIIDMGCGSGILSIAALLLGAKRAVGVDIDPGAIKSATENARLNNVLPQFDLGIGSVEEIKQGKFSIQKSDFVIVNILAKIIIQLFEDGLGDLLTDEGVMVLSGILESQLDDIQTAIKKQGLNLAEKCYQGDWLAICVTRK